MPEPGCDEDRSDPDKYQLVGFERGQISDPGAGYAETDQDQRQNAAGGRQKGSKRAAGSEPAFAALCLNARFFVFGRYF